MDCIKVGSGYCNGYLSCLEINKTYIMKLWDKIRKAEKYFTAKEYTAIVELARELFERGQFDLCEKELKKLPTDAKLLGKLVEKLKGKSVYKTLKLIQEGKAVENSLTTAKGLSSLLTHIIIEVELGNNEYKVLVPSIIEKLNEIIYSTLQ